MTGDPTPTGPLSEEAKRLAKEYDAQRPKFGERITMNERSDPRVTKAFAWLGGILGVIVTAAAITGTSMLINLDKQVGILLDRPAPVSKAQYDQDRQETNATLKTLTTDVNEIKIKQAEARQYGGR